MSIMDFTLSEDRVSTVNAKASPPSSWISRATVSTVDKEEFGSGGNGMHLEASERDFAEMATL